MERIETAEALAGLMNAARPRWSNCYRLPEELHKAVEAGRLYAHRQPGALMLLEEWPDVFQVCALVYDVAAPCEAPCVAKPLLAECITRGGPVEPGFAAFWAGLGMRPAGTRRMLENTLPAGASRPARFPVQAADAARLKEAKMLFADSLERLTVRLPWRMEESDVLCALDDQGNLAGALHFSHERGVGTLEHLAVRPDLRRRGVAGTLMARWLELPVGARRRLWVLEENLPAAALYERWGFADTGRRCHSLLRT